MEKELKMPKGWTIGKTIKTLEKVFGKLEWKREIIERIANELPREQTYENSEGTKVIIKCPLRKNFVGGFYIESSESDKKLINYGLELTEII